MHIPPGAIETATPSSPAGCRRSARGASAAVANVILLAKAVVVAGLHGGKHMGPDGLGTRGASYAQIIGFEGGCVG